MNVTDKDILFSILDNIPITDWCRVARTCKTFNSILCDVRSKRDLDKLCLNCGKGTIKDDHAENYHECDHLYEPNYCHSSTSGYSSFGIDHEFDSVWYYCANCKLLHHECPNCKTYCKVESYYLWSVERQNEMITYFNDIHSDINKRGVKYISYIKYQEMRPHLDGYVDHGFVDWEDRVQKFPKEWEMRVLDMDKWEITGTSGGRDHTWYCDKCDYNCSYSDK